MMPRVEVVYATPAAQRRYVVELAAGGTVRAAIEQCGVLRDHPQIDLGRDRVGVYGRLVGLDETLGEGDRVEILRGLVADPQTARQRRAQSARRKR
jgi:putative ubiquitin-RnfH superfamily antitoxin RatB of RatAB toxin-antitoxin module